MADNSTGEKTESATPKRRQDARERGQVLKSMELVMTGSLFIMFGALKVLTPMIAGNIMNFSASFLSGQYLTNEVLNADNIGPVMQEMIFGFLQIMLPILAIAVLGAVLLNIIQTGFLFSTKADVYKRQDLRALKAWRSFLLIRPSFRPILYHLSR